MGSPRHHDVVIVGGGNAGISLAAKLRRMGCQDVAVVEPKRVHHYRPLLSYVGGGMATLEELTRPQAKCIPSGCTWYANEVVGIDPDRSVVHLATGPDLHYTDVAVCPGSRVDWAAIPGSEEAVGTAAAATSYLPEQAVKTWTMLSSLTAGRAVFVISDRHVPCAPVGLKPLFMAADHWRRSGVLGDIVIELLVEGSRLVNHDDADRELRTAADSFGVRVRTRTTAEAVRASARSLRVRSPEGTDDLTYDALYLAPPHRAPQWVAASGLSTAEAAGFAAVDPHTLQHVRHPRVWGLGDVATVDTLPSGGALRRQVPVVAHNIAAQRAGRGLRRYDGYSVAPVTTNRRELLLAEFDRDGHPEPSVSTPDLARPRRSTFVFDRYLEPRIYWHRLLKGNVR
ncbi:NAD(P)/FAD-dependent oxidoreductase [Georgenia thermotolerans]|uniref:NAD(P)/FAD-dependent oxidoreductase n=1 Tax=Georgenia thermotolerans TaxID=527326 RepID=A0A7J5USQ0_9MICO|nr:FAD/NAD(P)-binding oxidoreductase [Georgenia thermotolerans]KAE8765307.1 NAD(P)/FAD-dependent oxidoreductase [Georgenia thermotolerans]